MPSRSATRRSRALFSGLAMAIATLSVAVPAQPVESWEIPGVGLRLTLPRGWSPGSDPAPGMLTAAPADGRGQVAVLSSPVPIGADGPSLDLEQAADASVVSLKKSIQKFKLMSRNDVEVAGEQAVELYFRGRVGGAKFRWIQTLLLHAGHQVVLMYAAPDEFYLNHLGDYDQILRSLRPTD